MRELDAVAAKKFGKMLENVGMKTKTTLYGAPVVVLLSGKLVTELPKEFDCVKLENLHRGIYWAMGSVMQNMQLRATSLELASCPINTVVVILF
ncbi:nitroreductase family protein [uncultured Campylobacter sp.]|uniref:nitroreductase family protein n=1 Tax=uncultured Campylobacter sp. TaxID=218934 RepID=UPI00262CFED8|nr:nitroreductase family protein [uncultured Campylobacter sp.]